MNLNLQCKSWLQKAMHKGSVLALLTLFFLGAADAAAQSPNISLDYNNAKLEQILESIETQSNYLFVYGEDIDINSRRTIKVDQKPLPTALNSLFAGQSISYKIEGKSIVLKANKEEPARQRTVSGSVKDDKGQPVVGAAITVAGTAVGVGSDLSGAFTLSIPQGKDVIQVSYLGMETQTISIGSQTHINVVMTEAASIDVGEVVVTAFGMKRETKSLTYNVQEIGADDFNAVKDPNIMNSLAGKIAGVQINQSATGVGGTSRVVMRGAKSLIGNNDPLYVIDGIPMSSFKSSQGTNFYENEYGGDFEGISLINQDDIESISVLTGAAAAAIYGHKGSNGVLIVTTKKGTTGKTKVTLSNNTTFMSPLTMPEFQNTYGRASDATFDSWGEKSATPYSYDPKDFFQTGVLQNYSLGVSAGSETSQTYVSASLTDSKGIIPNNNYERYNFTFRNSTEYIKDILTGDVTLNYTNQKDQNMYGQGQYYNPLVPLYLFPPSDDINKYRVYQRYDETRNGNIQYWPYGAMGMAMQNPYWIINKNMFNSKRDKYTMTAALTVKFTDWLTGSARVRFDKLESLWTRKLYASTSPMLAVGDSGHYIKIKSSQSMLYADALLNVDKQFGKNFRLTGMLGMSREDLREDFVRNQGPLDIPNYFHTSNFVSNHNATIPNENAGSLIRSNSAFATAQVGFKEYLYLDLTGRIDWFSTLSGTGKNYHAYPSAGLSGVITEMVDIPRNIVSFWKIRTSYSQVGTPLQSYITNSYATISNGTLGEPQYAPGNDLKPELTKAFEIGTDIRFLNNRLNIDFTYYNTNTYNQLFRYQPATSSQYTYAWKNAGKVNNWGIELAVNGRVDLGPVKWDPSLTYTLNRNKIKSLLPEEYLTSSGGTVDYVTANAGGAYIQKLVVGGTMSDIYVNTLRRDYTGAVFVDPNSGSFGVDPSLQFYAGKASPNYNLSFKNRFEYKGLSLDFLIDARVGGIVVSSTQALMDFYGTSKTSAQARDNGGVTIIGSSIVSAKTYYGVVGGGGLGVLSAYTYSATNVRLRELILSYNIPSRFFGDKINMSVSFIGRNLFMFYNKAPFDPELTGSTGTYYQGYDYFMPPSLRNIGFGVTVQF